MASNLRKSVYATYVDPMITSEVSPQFKMEKLEDILDLCVCLSVSTQCDVETGYLWLF